MMRALSLALTMVSLPWATVNANASPDGDTNAALKYWQAFSTLPVFSDNENHKIGDCLTTPLDEETKAILSKAEYSLRMLHRGAAQRMCDWGMSFDDGVYTLIPYANAARVLSSLACLRGRVHFEEGRTAEAVDDFVAAMTLGRHVSEDGTLITGLVGYNIEHRMIEALARQLPQLDPKTIKNLKSRIDALPPFGSQSRALLLTEKATIPWFVGKVQEAKDKDSLLKFLNWLDVSESENRAPGSVASAFLRDCGDTAEGVIKFANETLPFYDEAAKTLDLPLAEFEKQFQADSSKHAGNPVYRVFFPALARARLARARSDVRQALWSAAVAVQLGGPDALNASLDPVMGGPFEYTAFSGGFELRSKLKQQDDKPVMLVVGIRS